MRNGSAQRRPRAEEAGGRQAQHVLHRHSAGGAGEQMSDAPRGWCDGAGPAQTVAKKAADAFFCSHTFFCSKLSNILLFCKIQARQSFVGCYSRPGVFRDSASQKVSSLRLALVVLRAFKGRRFGGPIRMGLISSTRPCPTSPGAHPRGGRSALARARTTQCAPPARAAAPPQAPAPPDAPFLLVPCMPLVCVLYVTLYGSTCVCNTPFSDLKNIIASRVYPTCGFSRCGAAAGGSPRRARAART
jgi:hypothetical protein